MSPYESFPHSKHDPLDEDLREVLADFGVTSNGFLPAESPLELLPDSYYQPWESLISHLPSSLEHKTLRSEVDALPVLSVDRLKTEPERRRAYLILSILTHAYMWGGDKPSEVNKPHSHCHLSSHHTH